MRSPSFLAKDARILRQGHLRPFFSKKDTCRTNSPPVNKLKIGQKEVFLYARTEESIPFG